MTSRIGNWGKWSQIYIPSTNRVRKVKTCTYTNLKVENLYLRSTFRNFVIFTPFVMSLTPNWDKKGQICNVLTNRVRIVKTFTYINFSVENSFLRPTFRYFQILTPCDVTKPKLGKKGPNM